MPNEKITLFFTKLDAALADIPTIIGNEVVNYSLEAFEKQGWNGVPWEPLKNKKDANRAIEVNSGALKRSPRVIRSTLTSVIVGSDLVYAGAQNNGAIITRHPHSELFTRNRFTKGKRKGQFAKGTKQGKGYEVREYKINIPSRRFLGYVPELGERIKMAAVQRLKEVKQQ